MTKRIIIYVFIFLTILNITFSQALATNCSLDMHHLLPKIVTNDSSICETGSWGGFIDNVCCGEAFDDYLYALSRRANLTGDIFLNSTEQKICLSKFAKDAFGCGILKLTSGAGGCSDYRVIDVVDKLGDRLKSLDEYCKDLRDGKLNQSWNACLRSWEEIGRSLGNVCRFAVLITLVGTRVDDIEWVRTLFKILREESSQAIIADEKGSRSSSSNMKKHIGLWIFIIVALLGIAIALLVTTCILLRRKTGKSLVQGKDASDESFYEESSCMKISIKEVNSATNNLSEENFIGQGISGKVYKGILSNGKHVAVKHIINDGYVETFVREVRSLSHVRHPNLVALLGYCEDKNECFLVYELCHNGNLSEWMYGKDRVLPWMQRLEIAIDCARGLWFLHTYPEGRIVHRDIKPTNILIDAEFQAKLADFGLSKVMDIGQSFVSSEVRGTFGYVDPEYRRNHHVSAAGDVYSFGIVLLQLLSGQRVINLNVNRPMSLDKMAKSVMRGGNITEFADPKLNGEYSTEAFDLILKLALQCTGLKEQRPSMEQVVLRLENTLHISSSNKI